MGVTHFFNTYFINRGLIYGLHKSKRKYIIFGIVLAITLLIVGIAYYLISLNNAKGQVKEFEKLVQHNDYNSIAKKLSNKEETLSENDAKNFVLFVKSKENQEQYNEQIQKLKVILIKIKTIIPCMAL